MIFLCLVIMFSVQIFRGSSRRRPVKKVFIKNSQFSYESTCVGAFRPATILKKDCNAGVILKNVSERLLHKGALIQI